MSQEQKVENHKLDNVASEILKNLTNSETTEVRQLFIGNLPFRVRWQDIKDLFRKAGHVVRADVALNHENRSKGHGTVLFTTVEEAQKAINMFNGYKWKERTLEVRADRSFVDTEEEPKPTLKRTEEDNNKSLLRNLLEGKISQEVSAESTIKETMEVDENKNVTTFKEKTKEPDNNDDCKQLFVGNIPFHCQPSELKELFQTCGRILKVDIVLNFEGRSRGFGTVLFSLHEDAKNAIEKFDGYEFHHRILKVHFDKFAASHQRLREQEAETYGQRQLQDPASVELLKETYLPQNTYNQLLSGFLKPPVQSTYTEASHYTIPTTTYYPMSYNNNVYSSSLPSPSNYGLYQQSRERYVNTTSSSNMYASMYPQHTYYQPWMNSPTTVQQQQQQNYNDMDLTSNQFQNSAGLNNSPLFRK